MKVCTYRSIAALAAIAALSGSFALAADHTTVPVEKVTWMAGPPTLPPGAELAVLHGSPAKEDPFVIRLKFPAGYKIMPHRHSKEEQVTVISGQLGIGSGEKHDMGAAPLLNQGSFVRIPAGMAHFAWTDQGAVVQINGTGPFDVTYVNQADDPRQKMARQ